MWFNGQNQDKKKSKKYSQNKEDHIMIAESKTIHLPQTTPNRYLTAMTALNLPAPEKTRGAPHFEEHFFGKPGLKPQFVVAGDKEALNTNLIFGHFGIYECSDSLRAKGITLTQNEKVYAANHNRAILDMLYSALKNKEHLDHITLNDWIDIKEQKKELLDKIKQFKDFLEIDEWMVLMTWLSRQT